MRAVFELYRNRGTISVAALVIAIGALLIEAYPVAASVAVVVITTSALLVGTQSVAAGSVGPPILTEDFENGAPDWPPDKRGVVRWNTDAPDSKIDSFRHPLFRYAEREPISGMADVSSVPLRSRAVGSPASAFKPSCTQSASPFPYLLGHTAHLSDRFDVEAKAELVAVQEEDMGARAQGRLAI